MAVLAARHDDFLQRGGRLFGISADTPAQNAAVVEKLALTFPILSDRDRDQAITPLGFADESDPRRISRPGTVILSPDGEVVFSVTGRDYADRPEEDVLIESLAGLGLVPVTQEPPETARAAPGEKAMPYAALGPYFRGAKFAVTALRGRHRDLSDEFRQDTKWYIQMVDRYIEALTMVEGRKT